MDISLPSNGMIGANVIVVSCNLPGQTMETVEPFLQGVAAQLEKQLSKLYTNTEFAWRAIGAATLNGEVQLHLMISPKGEISSDEALRMLSSFF